MSFDVITSDHDAVKVGVVCQRRSRVVVEADTYAAGVELAACLAMAVHGGMATEVLPRI
jgi:hypothetical protein